MHASTLVTAGVFLLIRSSPLLEYSSTVLLLSLWAGALTSVFSSLVGLFQNDIKKIIAFSTSSQLAGMFLAIGLSSYNIALYHLIQHAFYKSALFLGAGSVLHSVADNQDLRKMGGLRRYLPVTYPCMLIASFSLIAFPWLSGFYSKDLILESALGAFSVSGVAIYAINLLGAIFTTVYSLKILYFAFLSWPLGPKENYKNGSSLLSWTEGSKEGGWIMIVPLVVLSLLSILFGYLTRDYFVGLGTGFFVDNSIWNHPSHEILISTEFGNPGFFKLLPLIYTIVFSVLAIVLFEFYPKFFIYVKFSNIGLGRAVCWFFNHKALIDMLYSNLIVNKVLTAGGHINRILDRGVYEIVGISGLEKNFFKYSKFLHSFSTAHVTTYGLYILIGFVFFSIVWSMLESLQVIIFSIIFIVILGSDYSNNEE